MKRINIENRLDKHSFEKLFQNEIEMKNRGEKKEFRNILKKNGSAKNVCNTQEGQKIIMDESIRVLDQVHDWIYNKSGSSYKDELTNYFADKDFILKKILECYLYMSGSIYLEDSKKGKTSRHKRISSLQRIIMPELSFESVWRFLEVIISFSDYFDTKTETSVIGKSYKKTIKYTCSLSEVILEKVTNVAINSFYPLPMKTPPINWKLTPNGIVGGYQTYQYEMVRSTGGKLDYTKFSDKIYDSVNYIQSVPWIINDDVLQQLKHDLKLPLKEDFVKSSYPDPDGCHWELDIKDKETIISKSDLETILSNRQSYKDKAALYNAEVSDYQSALGKYRYAKLAVQIAEQYVGETIYFPHSFDFRGRVYPLPIGLSPQGSDSIKALLLYKNNETLTKHGLKWCWAYMASLWGDDKLPFEERIERGKELINANYKDADEPYQFLSHQLEMKKYLANANYKPSVRIHLDACNSGSQFTSAITGDLAGCKATNVIPTINNDKTQDRQDAYILVANKSIELCEEILENPNEKDIHETVEFFHELLKKDGRKICKVPVMVSNYGGTAGGRSTILWHMMRELGVERKWITKKNASLFSKIIGNSITGVLNGGKAFETYIHKMNNCIAKHNVPINWTTSDGFYVLHYKNKELKPKRIYCKIPGSRKETTLKKKIYSKDLSSVKMKSAISPNYIHSLDAELLRRVALRMKNIGVMDTDWIHDSFGAHPNHIYKLLEVTKEEFLNLMITQPLSLLHKQLCEQVPVDDKSQKELSLVQLPMLNGFNEEENLEKVLKSHWFFS